MRNKWTSSNEEYKEYADEEYRKKAIELGEKVGREYMGMDKAWVIDIEQRTIPDHFHIHVRDLTAMSPSFIGLHLFQVPSLKPKLWSISVFYK